jgi:hypothetical protein
MDVLPCSKNSQALHEARLQYSEQLPNLCRLLIPNRIHVIKLETDSNLNLLWILKGFKPSGKYLIIFWKFSFNMVFTKVNLDGHTFMQEFQITAQVSNDVVWTKEKSLNLKFKPHNIYNTNQTCKDFIQASGIHSEWLFKHCSCYNGTRGVTLSTQAKAVKLPLPSKELLLPLNDHYRWRRRGPTSINKRRPASQQWSKPRQALA